MLDLQPNIRKKKRQKKSAKLLFEKMPSLRKFRKKKTRE
jgi:hypothetical protein